jgi:hypothetical protein
VPWTEFWRIRHTWFRATGDAPQHWAKIGRNLFVVYPAPLTSLVVEITYVAILDTVTRLTDAILLRNEFLPLLLDLVEALFLFRLRYFGEGPTDPFDVVLQRLQSHMGIGKGAT